MPANKAPLITICIPVYNCADYLGLAIESVLKQTFTDFELVIIDDCSTDTTLKIAQSYSDERIRIVQNEKNLGHAGNWNKSLTVITGEYFKLLCADDILYPTCLEKEINIFKEHPDDNIAIVACGRHIINKDGKILTQRSFGKRTRQLTGIKAVRQIIRSGTNPLGEPHATLISSDIIRKTGHYDGSLYFVIDVDFYCRALLQGNLYFIAEPLCAFRVSNVSWSVGAFRLQFGHYRDFIARLANNPAFNLTLTDQLIGVLHAKINQWLRFVFYKLFV